MKGLHVVQISLFLLLFVKCLKATNEASIEIPEKVKKGDDITLYCKYDLRDDRLFTIRWLLNGAEFYRFRPRARPQQISQSVPAINLDLVASNEEKVILRNVSVATSGVFKCEVLLEGNMRPMIGEATLAVIESAPIPPLAPVPALAAAAAAKTKVPPKILPKVAPKVPQKKAAPPKTSSHGFFYFAEKIISVSALLYYLYSMIIFFK